MANCNINEPELIITKAVRKNGSIVLLEINNKNIPLETEGKTNVLYAWKTGKTTVYLNVAKAPETPEGIKKLTSDFKVSDFDAGNYEKTDDDNFTVTFDGDTPKTETYKRVSDKDVTLW